MKQTQQKHQSGRTNVTNYISLNLTVMAMAANQLTIVDPEEIVHAMSL